MAAAVDRPEADGPWSAAAGTGTDRDRLAPHSCASSRSIRWHGRSVPHGRRRGGLLPSWLGAWRSRAVAAPRYVRLRSGVGLAAPDRWHADRRTVPTRGADD